jgi:hypothetical protein
VEGGNANVAGIERRYAKKQFPGRMVVREMIARKRRHFGSDLRLVDHWAVVTGPRRASERRRAGSRGATVQALGGASRHTSVAPTVHTG